jgi:hypothetical protein
MLYNVKDSEGIRAVGQWSRKDGVPDVVWREGSQRVAELWVIICVGYFHDNDIQGRSGHES